MLNHSNLARSLTAMLALCGLAALSASADTVVMEDNFDYADNEALRAVWLLAGTSPGNNASPTLETTFTSDASGQSAGLSSQAMKLRNGLIYRELGQTVTDDFSLNFKMLQSNYPRGQYLGLINEDGTQGYAISWISAQVDSRQGQGYAELIKIDYPGGWNDFTQTGSAMDGNTGSTGHPATGYEVLSAPDHNPSNATYGTTFTGLVDFELTWEKDTGALTLYIDGDERLSTIDTDFDSFSRVYLRGNSSVFVDDVLVTTVPEPGTLGLLLVGTALMASRRRRHPG